MYQSNLESLRQAYHIMWLKIIMGIYRLCFQAHAAIIITQGHVNLEKCHYAKTEPQQLTTIGGFGNYPGRLVVYLLAILQICSEDRSQNAKDLTILSVTSNFKDCFSSFQLTLMI